MDEEGGYGRGQIISDTPDCMVTSVVGTVRLIFGICPMKNEDMMRESVPVTCFSTIDYSKALYQVM